MHISELKVTNFRLFTEKSWSCNAGCNLILGENGSGKTSLLEAIYILGFGRSFRTSQLNAVVLQGASDFVIYAAMQSQERNYTLGFRKQARKIDLRYNQDPIAALREFIKNNSCLLFSPETVRLFTEGPEARRSAYNWLLFHVDPNYGALWGRYKKILKHRGQLLLSGGAEKDLEVWDLQLVSLANELFLIQDQWMAVLEQNMLFYLESFGFDWKMKLQFYKGWEGNDLGLVLKRNFLWDKKRGTTHAGPHRADLLFLINNQPAACFLSRGQQKMLVLAFLLSQAMVLNTIKQDPPIFLLDDICSELDEKTRSVFFDLLQTLQYQFFLTGSEASLFTETFKRNASLITL